MSIGMRIQQVVDASGLSPKAFAEAAGMPYSSFHSYLKDQREPGSSAIVKICSTKRIDANWLLTGEGDMHRAQPDAHNAPFSEELLSDIIEVLEGLCVEYRVTLPPRKKSEAIMLLYDYFQDDGKVERQTVARVLRLVA